MVAPEGSFSLAGPLVRIHLPPAESRINGGDLVAWLAEWLPKVGAVLAGVPRQETEPAG